MSLPVAEDKIPSRRELAISLLTQGQEATNQGLRKPPGKHRLKISTYKSYKRAKNRNVNIYSEKGRLITQDYSSVVENLQKAPGSKEIKERQAREMAQQSQALSALAEDPNLVPSADNVR